MGTADYKCQMPLPNPHVRGDESFSKVENLSWFIQKPDQNHIWKFLHSHSSSKGRSIFRISIDEKCHLKMALPRSSQQKTKRHELKPEERQEEREM